MLKFNFKKNKIQEGGFTLVETLVALSIFTLAVLAMMVALGGGLKSVNFAKNKIVASYLAQEGIELMRNVRDRFVLHENGWADFLAHVSDCQNTPCIFHTEYIKYDGFIESMEIEPCATSLCPPMYYHLDTQVYDHNGTNNWGNDVSQTVVSQFRRHIRIEIVNTHEARISSFVTFDNGADPVGFTENIFNWY